MKTEKTIKKQDLINDLNESRNENRALKIQMSELVSQLEFARAKLCRVQPISDAIEDAIEKKVADIIKKKLEIRMDVDCYNNISADLCYDGESISHSSDYIRLDSMN